MKVITFKIPTGEVIMPYSIRGLGREYLEATAPGFSIENNPPVIHDTCTPSEEESAKFNESIVRQFYNYPNY